MYIQKPPSINFSGNVPDLIINSEQKITVRLYQGGNLLFAYAATPDIDNSIRIELRKLIHDAMPIPGLGVDIPFAEFSITADNHESITFMVVRGGIDADVNCESWMQVNWLSWRPQRQKVLMSQPNWISYAATLSGTIRATGVFEDRSMQEVVVTNVLPGMVYTEDIAYARLKGLFEQTPAYIDLYVCNADGQRITYVQRLIPVNPISQYNDVFVFLNSIGGYDSVNLTGLITAETGVEPGQYEIDDTINQYETIASRSYTKNTGFIPPDQRMWHAELLSSSCGFHLKNGDLKPIVLSDVNIQDQPGTPGSYEFKFEYSRRTPFINISRVAELPEEIEIVAPSGEVFPLAPRLYDFPLAGSGANLMIPCQKAGEERWYYIFASSLGGGGAGGDLIFPTWADILGKPDTFAPSPHRHEVKDVDFSKGIDDPVRFNDRILIGEYQSGVRGGCIKETGEAELTSLTLSNSLKVPTMIYNKVKVTGGKQINNPGGVVQEVIADSESENSMTLVIDCEEGDLIDFEEDDICQGIYNMRTGFITSYFRVTAVNYSSNTIRIVMGDPTMVPGGVNNAPVKFMTIAQYGNFTKKERQRCQVFDSANQEILMLSGVDRYIVRPEDHSLILGDVTKAKLPANLPINPNDCSGYMKNIIVENIFQIDSQGEIVKTIRDRGLWSADIAKENPYLCTDAEQDDVWHKSCKYRCISTHTQEEPRYDATGWLLMAGDTSLSMELSSSNGYMFLQGQLKTSISAIVKRGVDDITSEIQSNDWNWTRQTQDAISDMAWNAAHQHCTDTIDITDLDMIGLSGVFTCTAYVRDGGVTENFEFQ